MYFNPLFIQTTGVDDPTNNIKQLKLGKDSYLFSDIIKLNYEKSKVGENDLLGSTGIGELENVVSSGSVVKKEEVLDQFVGMPNLQMFTIVEPKVLNSLVEKVFQSGNITENSNEFFVLNKNVDVDHDLKSEIYGSEEKLVQFLEQLLPGMALIDTSKTNTMVDGKKAEGNNDLTNLTLLPLPGKENVVQDVLKRLKAGETVQITAKVGDEKIKLDISKVTQPVVEGNTITPKTETELSSITAPTDETASVQGKVKAQTNNIAVNFGEKYTSDDETISVSKVLNEVSTEVEASTSKTQPAKVTTVKPDVNPEQSQVEIEKPVQKVLKAEETVTNKNQQVEINESVDVKSSELPDKFSAVNKSAVQSSENTEKGSVDTTVKASDLLKSEQSHVKTNIHSVKIKTEEVEQNKTAENVGQVENNKNISKPDESNYLESSRMYMQNKSFKPLLSEKENKEDKYKIEITQETTEENTHEVFKKSNITVENLLNYKNQSAKVNADVKNPNVNMAADQNNKEESSETSKENVVKSEIKTHKPSLDVKVNHGIESAQVKSESGFEKIMKNTQSVKEVVRTVKSNEVVKEIKTIMQAGEHKTMIVKLIPENLGKMKVIIDVAENNQMKANIEVENESVKQLIMSNVESLKQAITQSGLQLGSFSVSLTNPEGRMKREFEQKRKEQGGNAEVKVEKTITDEIKEKKLGYNTYEYLA